MRAEAIELSGRTAKFDLVFSFSEDRESGAVSCLLEYAADLFDKSTAVMFADRLVRLIDVALANPGMPVSQLDIMAPGERERVLTGFNQTDAAVAEVSLPVAFEAQVARRPDAVAIVDGERKVTYAHLDGLANRVARALAAQGIGEHSVVAVAMPRSVEMVATVLGILKLGAAFLPIDLSLPADRVEYMLADSGAATVVDLARYAELSDVDTALLGTWRPSLNHPAYLIYTSGSTGKPKGVMVSHDGIGSLVATAMRRMELTEDSHVLQFASIGFDVAVFELAMAMCTGARLIVAPDCTRVPGPPLTDLLHQEKVTHMILPPSLVSALPPECELPDNAVVLVGTETVSPDIIRRWAPKLRLFAAYGLTEATVNSTLWRAQPGWQAAVPIGIPDPNTHAYVLDRRLQPVPSGVAGELYIAGRGLALGYLNRPGLTASRFLPDPFAAPGARMYRTGDRARWKADGTLDFLGRVDQQVKIRGFRIELGEIEAVLTSHPAVAQAAVVADGGRLAGYVVGAGLDLPALKGFLAAQLPEYMVPSVLVELPGRLPLTPNGKLDRKALPVPDWGSLAGTAPATTPREQLLADLFAEVLDLPAAVGVTGNFFTLGGHSMSSMRLAGRIHAVFGVEVSIRDIFEAPTVATLAERIEAPGRAPLPPLVPAYSAAEATTLVVDAGEGGPSGIVLGEVQRQWWQGAKTGWDVAFTLGNAHELDQARLAWAVDAVVHRHWPLRTVFEERDGQVWQRETNAVPRLETVDGDAETLAREQIDLTVQPPLRVRLLDNELLVTVSYLGVDEWSVVPLIRDLMTSYAGGVPEALPVSYPDYPHWAAQVLQICGPQQRDYWRATLDGLDASTLGMPGRRAGAQLEFTIEGVEKLTRATGTTMFMVFQAALARVLAQQGFGDIVPVSALAAGRTRQELTDLVGSFANRLVLLTDLTGQPEHAEVLTRIRRGNLSAFDNADVALTAHPKVMMVHHEQARLSNIDGVTGSLAPVHTGIVHAELTFSFYEPREPGPVRCVLGYATETVTPQRAQSIVAALQETLKEMSVHE